MRRIALALLLASPVNAGTAVDLNQTGFAPGAPRTALVRGDAADPLPWELRDATGRVVLAGRSQPLGFDSRAGQKLQRVDFSGAAPAGEGYRLVVGGAESPAFAIGPGLLAPIARDAFHYFYHNRSGVPIEARFAGGERWARPAGHPAEVVGCFAGTDEHGNRWPGCDYQLDVTGGWYDAGDHGKYVVNGGIALWTLMNLHELLPGAFPDGSMPIPEAGNSVSDLLDEARTQMEFHLRMQVPDGARMQLPIGHQDAKKPLRFTTVDAGGMAHLKIADERWTKLPLRPDHDRERRFLYPPSTSATLNLAANAAQCARVWRQIDQAFSARCLKAAERAWAAARRNPDVIASWDFAGSGGYGDPDVSDEFYWAASELFATTGAAEYRQALLKSPHFATISGEPGWPSVAPLGTLTLAIVPNGLGAAEQGRVKQAILGAADGWAAERAQPGYAIPYASETYAWGSNSNLLNRALVMGVAYQLAGNPAHRAAAADVMDYLLGRNPMGTSYVSGHGEKAMRAPHHRFWANSLDPRFPPPPPGALSGGPNNRAMSDEVATKMKGHCAAQTCWVDDAQAFTMNEVAVNWNAPLVWVASWLDTTEARAVANLPPSPYR